jgi:hypothetical protein
MSRDRAQLRSQNGPNPSRPRGSLLRLIFVSSGGMYTERLALDDLPWDRGVVLPAGVVAS